VKSVACITEVLFLCANRRKENNSYINGWQGKSHMCVNIGIDILTR
jgi:hypothetical protein